MGWKEVSAEELFDRAMANGYKQGAHKTDDSKRNNTKYEQKTLKDQNWALGRYKKWVDAVVQKKQDTGEPLLDIDTTDSVCNTTGPQSLRDGLPALDLATIKDFLRFHIALSRGRIEQRTTVDSVNTFAEWFFAGFARVTGNVIDDEDRRAVYDWTRNTLTRDGLVVNKKKPKQNFGEKELVQFNTTFWTIDDDQFIHPRNKAQVPFAIAVFCWTGARIGAFFPNQKSTNGPGLRYQDIEVVLVRIPSGGWKVIYRIDQRWVKNNRDPENIVYGASTSQHGKLLYDDTQYLLALALADKAFWGINSSEDLWQLQIPHGENELILRWTDSVKSLPILRNATKEQGVSEEPLPRKTFDRIVKSVLNLSGYFGMATVHAIRRYLGKRSMRYTEVERSQHITQTDTRVYGQSYVANTSSVDGRSAFLNEPAQHDHIDYFQSFAKFREKGLPGKLPAEREAMVRQDPQLVELEDQIRQLEVENATASQIKAAKNKARGYCTRLTQKRLRQYQLEWVQRRRDWKVTTRGKEQPEDDAKTDFLEILSVVMPERGRLARTMISDKVISERERRQAIEDLCSLVSRDCTILYRPEEEPIDGVCPVRDCGVEMISLCKPQRSTHIHNCRHKERACTLGRLPSELKYCFACFSWFVEEEWDKHCQTHLKSITSKRCASITYCNTLFRPAFCPFCMGNDTLPASIRWNFWTRENKLRSHLQSHLDASSWPLPCPHPLCSLRLDNETSYVYHLTDVHSLRPSSRMKKCQQKKNSLEPFINWTPDAAGRKRKRQETDEQEPLPLKQDKDSRHSMGNTLSNVPVIDLTKDDDLQNPPELTQSGATSPPDANELEQWRDLPEAKSNEVKPLDGSLSSLFLRLPSPSCSSAKDISDDNNDQSIYPQTVAPSDICLSMDEEPNLADWTDLVAFKLGDVPINTKKPRITLRITKPKPKPKITLRLSQPALATSHKPDVNNRRRRRA